MLHTFNPKEIALTVSFYLTFHWYLAEREFLYGNFILSYSAEQEYPRGLYHGSRRFPMDVFINLGIYLSLNDRNLSVS